jgi:hypothetical protein
MISDYTDKWVPLYYDSEFKEIRSSVDHSMNFNISSSTHRVAKATHPSPPSHCSDFCINNNATTWHPEAVFLQNLNLIKLD